MPAPAAGSGPLRVGGLGLAAAAGVVLLAAGVLLAVLPGHARPGPAQGTPTVSGTTGARPGPAAGRAGGSARGSDAAAREKVAGAPMPVLAVSAASPAAVSTRDAGPPLLLPACPVQGAAGVATGCPHTPAGAMAALAAIDQAGLGSGSMAGVRAVIAAWALPGGPSTSSWSGVAAMASILSAAGVAGTSSGGLGLVVTPVMGLIKGTVGADFVVPCIDFEFDITAAGGTARVAVADCQRMVWAQDRWMIGPGPEPVQAPSVWPDTDTAIKVGYRDLILAGAR